jgi:hypothetical protein
MLRKSPNKPEQVSPFSPEISGLTYPSFLLLRRALAARWFARPQDKVAAVL